MEGVLVQTDVLGELLERLPVESRLAGLHESLDLLHSAGVAPEAVRMIEFQMCARLGLPVSDASERLPHIFVNYVQSAASGIKLGFMTRRGGEETIRGQAERIKTRLAAIDCKIVGSVVEPTPEENFFWFRVEERDQPPTVRELLESFDDVILR